jgi:hypothetical protein
MENIKKLIMNNHSNIPEDKIIQALSKDVLDGLDVDLVSIWYFEDNNTKLTCQFSLDRFEKRYLSGLELMRTDFPIYFSLIIEGISILADNVYTNPNTKELIETYFQTEQYKIAS